MLPGEAVYLYQKGRNQVLEERLCNNLEDLKNLPTSGSGLLQA